MWRNFDPLRSRSNEAKLTYATAKMILQKASSEIRLEIRWHLA